MKEISAVFSLGKKLKLFLPKAIGITVEDVGQTDEVETCSYHLLAPVLDKMLNFFVHQCTLPETR
jgi:hypothetical protein